MNRNQLLQTCQEQLAAKRARAQSVAYSNLLTAKKNTAFIEIDKKEKEMVFEIGKLKAFGKPCAEQEALLSQIRNEKHKILANLSLTEEDLAPSYSCKKCNDNGYNSRGMCECLSSMLNKMIIKECGAGKEQLNDFANFDAEIANNPEQIGRAHV